MKKLCSMILLLCAAMTAGHANAGEYDSFRPGKLWFDTDGNIINAHGGGIVRIGDTWYWYGEHKSEESNNALVGVMCYSSKDLYNWKNEGVALSVSDDPGSPIVRGSIIERPKVIHNAKTGKFVMYFHLELRGQGYNAAQRGVAVADAPAGPFRFVKNGRVNPGKWPTDMTGAMRNSTVTPDDFDEWWTPEWRRAVDEGLFARRDHEGGQMARDMTLFVDDDGRAYHIYASEENLTLNIAELTDDYLDYTGKWMRVAPAGHNEAPAIFKREGTYHMITSGCTGWAPNAARQFTAPSIWGPWAEHSNPCSGPEAELTFRSQSTYILPVAGERDAFIFMADRWIPSNPIDGRYVWLPIVFEDGLPVLKWFDEWRLDDFDGLSADSSIPKAPEGYELVWNDEFDRDGAPDPEVWMHERGFERNLEYQWYQPDNAICKDGVLTITGRKERVKNPDYEAGSDDWRRNREYAEYTSSAIKTRGKKEFMYGRFEIRARIPTAGGAWPAIWTLGNSMSWPSCGEIDIMEYYRIKGVPHILANTAWGTDQPRNAKWDTVTVPFAEFTRPDPGWAEKFHIWRMDGLGRGSHQALAGRPAAQRNVARGDLQRLGRSGPESFPAAALPASQSRHWRHAGRRTKYVE